MKTLFISSGPYEWGSSRMRCYWPAKYMKDTDDVEVKSRDEIFGKPWVESVKHIINADTIVFQKQSAFDFDVVRHCKELGKKIVWDLCDPVWWWSPDLTRQISPLCNIITFSSDGLMSDFCNWEKPINFDPNIRVGVIPDRLDLDHFTRQRVHSEHTPIRFIWYGVAVNRIAVYAALANLERLASNGVKIELTICDDRPDAPMQVTDLFPIYNVKWDLTQEVDVLTAHDVALLPPYPGPWGKVKSNNKKLTAWACGLPVTTGEHYAELYDLCHMLEMRQSLGSAGRFDVETNWRAEQSAAQWETILNR